MSNRAWSSNFNSTEEFLPFYITPDGSFGCNHSISTDNPLEGLYSHKATIISANGTDNSIGLPHRGYPSIQLYKTEGGSFKTPCRVSLKLWLSIALSKHGTNDWFSPITFTSDETDVWADVVTLSIGPEGYLNWEHVPTYPESIQIYQASAKTGGPKFPMNKWVALDMELDFDPVSGYAKVWQDGTIVSHAQVLGRMPRISQIHAGMYASSAVNAGTVFNGIIEIAENSLVNRPYHGYGISAITSVSGRG